MCVQVCVSVYILSYIRYSCSSSSENETLYSRERSAANSNDAKNPSFAPHDRSTPSLSNSSVFYIFEAKYCCIAAAVKGRVARHTDKYLFTTVLAKVRVHALLAAIKNLFHAEPLLNLA